MYNRRSFFDKSLFILGLGLFLLLCSHLIGTVFAASMPRPVDSNPVLFHVEPKTKLAPLDNQAETAPVAYYQPEATPTYVATAHDSTNYTASAPAPSDYVNIGGYNIPIFTSYNTLTDSGNSVGLYNGRFLYGHNTANVFAYLPNLAIGNNITIALNGAVTTYRVAYKVTMTKDDTQRIMGAIANARINGTQYDFALMTCAGTAVGYGDATHRTIVFVTRN